MRISLNWLKDFLDIKPDLDVGQLSEALTLAGLEVEGLEAIRERAKKISLGRVIAISPSADGFIYHLDVKGKTISAQGRSMVNPDMIVAFKPENDGFALATYGDLGFSLGMDDVIAFLESDLPEGCPEDLAAVKEFDDVIFTLGITPNRADALSHLGVSRELSAILDFNARSFMLSPKEMGGPIHEKVTIEIENAEDCPRYACRLIENVVVADSPYWMKLRLYAAGVRPINNVVDTTNYVMLSRGQPMHAFDYEELHKENGRAKIIVRRAKEGEKLRALDGKEYSLTPEDVVVADQEQPLALAGVIGGCSSAIHEGSKTILLESAYFDAKNVRLTARRHGISTESSYRFERGSDPNAVLDALNYAARLLSEMTEGRVCREPIDAYRKRIDPLEIKMRPERAQSILGMSNDSFDQDLLRRRFLRLGIETIAKRGDAIYFRVPTYRPDLTREIDLIEEAARMIGYDKVKETSLGLGLDGDGFSNKKLEEATLKLRTTLKARGFFECVNYSFLNKDFHDLFLSETSREDLIELKNPLSERYGVMRKTLIPGLIKNLLHNQRNQEKSIQIFECGTVFLSRRDKGRQPDISVLYGSLDQDSFCVEKQMIAGVMAGSSPFYAFDQPKQPLDFYHMKGVLSELFHALGLSDQFPHASLVFSHGAQIPYLHPGESSLIHLRSNDEDEGVILGHFGKLHPHISTATEVIGDVFVFEIDLIKVSEMMPGLSTFKPFSRFPTIERDVAFVVDESVKVGDILLAAGEVKDAQSTLSQVNVFDIYRGKNVAMDKKSVAISLSLQREDRTLKDEEAEAFVSEFVALVKNKFSASLR